MISRFQLGLSNKVSKCEYKSLKNHPFLDKDVK